MTTQRHRTHPLNSKAVTKGSLVFGAKDKYLWNPGHVTGRDRWHTGGVVLVLTKMNSIKTTAL